MKKEEFLAMSLPYGLKMINITYECTEILEMNGLFFPNAIHFKETNRDDYFHFYSKPILRPLSDLTKEIEHNGFKIIPLSEIIKDDGCNSDIQHLSRMIINLEFKELVLNYPFWVVQKLIEWHFDIVGLIEKGEAIDVNTLPENPYK